jgi:hypothetical protein
MDKGILAMLSVSFGPGHGGPGHGNPWTRGAAALVLALGLAAAGAPPQHPPGVAPVRWSIVRRAVGHDQGAGQAWVLDYTLRHDGAAPVALGPSDVAAEVAAWVSNSRVLAHATPRATKLAWPGLADPAAESVVVPSRDEIGRCVERGTLTAWAGASGEPPPESAAGGPIVVAPGATLRVRLRLEHVHFLYGPYEPLLGRRDVTLRLAGAELRDRVPLDAPARGAAPAPAWPKFEPPDDRMDTQIFRTPPDSLHLAAHVPGLGHYRLTGPVRYGTRMRLSFWYLIASGTDAEAQARISQIQQGPALWRPLPDGVLRMPLTAVGRWQRVERVFRTEPNATHMTLEFRLLGEVGDLWIDDVKLEPLEGVAEGP